MGFDLMCPHCHRLFSVKKEDKEVIIEKLLRQDRDKEKELPVGTYRGPAVIATRPVEVGLQTSSDIIVYTLHLRCKNCGHEWTETKEEIES